MIAADEADGEDEADRADGCGVSWILCGFCDWMTWGRWPGARGTFQSGGIAVSIRVRRRTAAAAEIYVRHSQPDPRHLTQSSRAMETKHRTITNPPKDYPLPDSSGRFFPGRPRPVKSQLIMGRGGSSIRDL